MRQREFIAPFGAQVRIPVPKISPDGILRHAPPAFFAAGRPRLTTEGSRKFPITFFVTFSFSDIKFSAASSAVAKSRAWDPFPPFTYFIQLQGIPVGRTSLCTTCLALNSAFLDVGILEPVYVLTPQSDLKIARWSIACRLHFGVLIDNPCAVNSLILL